MEMNLMAMLVAALVPLLMGFIWYHPKVFGNAWMGATGLTPESGKSMNMPLVFGLTFLLGLFVAYVMNIVVIHDGFIAGATFYATNKTMVPEPGSELAKWVEYYKTNLAASNHIFTHGAFHAFFLMGLGTALPVIAVNSLFERRGFKYIAITAGFWIITFVIMGGIIAGWR